MEFGRLTEAELDSADFTLPPDPVFNESVLTGVRSTAPKIYIGCAKWGRSEWVGKIYPKGTKEKNFLDQYVQHYNSIELNATHYKIYGARGIARWSAKAGDRDFLFCPKMYKGVTHRGRLKDKTFLATEFLRGITAFEQHLGPVLIQLSETFSPKRKDELFDFLRSLPTEMQFVVEVRHANWFADPGTADELFGTLKALNMGAVITDTAGRRDCAHMYVTVPKTFIRYVGNSLHATDYRRIDAWVNRIQNWIERGIQEIYFFMHMHDEALSPELTVYLVDAVNRMCGTNLKKPEFIVAPE